MICRKLLKMSKSDILEKAVDFADMFGTHAMTAVIITMWIVTDKHWLQFSNLPRANSYCY